MGSSSSSSLGPVDLSPFLLNILLGISRRNDCIMWLCLDAECVGVLKIAGNYDAFWYLNNFTLYFTAKPKEKLYWFGRSSTSTKI